MLATLKKLTEGLIVYPENMKRNMGLSHGMWHSQTVLLALIRKGLTREEAYELVQRNAMKTWQAKHAGNASADFKDQLLSDPDVAKHLSRAELDQLCSLEFHLKEVPARFQKLGIPAPQSR
jgi:adenylosuccinate lyase